MKTIITVLSALALAAAGAVLTGPGPAQAAGDRTPTAFAMHGSGFGTQAFGGEVPVGSDTTAFQAMGCTNLAGIHKENYVAEATLPGAGVAQELQTTLWTTQRNGVAASHSRDTIERVVFGGDAGQLEINGLKSYSRAFHTKDGFDTTTDTEVASIVFRPAAGPATPVELPTPGQSVPVPGIGTLTVGNHVEKVGRERAHARADALRLKLEPSGTSVRLAHSKAEIARGVKSGVFAGRGAAVQSTALDGNVALGYQPLSLMPCQGTDGELVSKDTAEVGLDNGIVLKGLTSRQQADQTWKMATGFERGRVDTVTLSDGERELLIEKVIGRSEVTRLRGGGLKRSTRGTTVGQIMLDGEEQTFPNTGVIEIPGLAKLERSVVTRTKHGLSVIGLRVTLLDGTGAVLNLGVATMSIRPSGI